MLGRGVRIAHRAFRLFRLFRPPPWKVGAIWRVMWWEGAEDTQTGYSWDHLAGYHNLGPFHGTSLGNGFSGGRVGK